MDLGTVQHRVDAGYYTTMELFEADIALIKSNIERYFGKADTSGYFSRASELVDKALPPLTPFPLPSLILFFFRSAAT